MISPIGKDPARHATIPFVLAQRSRPGYRHESSPRKEIVPRALPSPPRITRMVLLAACIRHAESRFTYKRHTASATLRSTRPVAASVMTAAGRRERAEFAGPTISASRNRPCPGQDQCSAGHRFALRSGRLIAVSADAAPSGREQQRGVACADCCSAEPGRRVVPRRPFAERRGAEAGQARGRHKRRYCFAATEHRPRSHIATASRPWPPPTSATSGGCKSAAPPTTRLVLVQGGGRR